jgi:hypothetical protein
MVREVEYLVRLGPADRYRHKDIREKGKIVSFSVQLETMVENQWHPVVRYDCAHGFAHRDLMQKNGSVIKTPVFIHDYNDALTFAESDLKANWKVYKERYLRG